MMLVPGSNQLALAMGVVASQSLQWLSWVARTETAAGELVSTFAAPVSIYGSFQPVNKTLYQQLGLNLAKDYWTLYTSNDVRVTARDREGDKLSFMGNLYQAESDQPWFGVDGWRKILCVGVPS